MGSCVLSCRSTSITLVVGSSLAIFEKERVLSWIRTKAKEGWAKALNRYLPREWVGGGVVRKVWCIVFFYQNFSLPHLLPNNFI